MSHDHTAIQIPLDLLKIYDRPGPRYTSYPTAPNWADDVGSDSYKEALTHAAKDSDFSLAMYCHIPFCQKRCYYCGCNTFIARGADSSHAYINKLAKEISSTAQLLGSRRRVSQLHFGGGTPTFVGIGGLTRVLDALENSFEFPSGCERSMEIDPRVTTVEQLEFLRERGFNRISLGVQDLDPRVQEAVGRVQSEEMVCEILSRCRRLGFKGINIDLIYGLPLQTPESFARTLDRIIQFAPDRLAVYSMAYLPKLKSHQSKIKPDDLPATETKYELFAIAIEKFTGAGYNQIGMDHFALPTDELSLAQADGRLNRNFMGYTVQSAREMIGLGMSSIGYVDNSFFQNSSRLEQYQSMIDDDGFAVFRGMRLSRDDLIRQYVITSFMCNFALSYSELKVRFGIEYTGYFAKEHRLLNTFFDDQLLTDNGETLSVTPVGRTFVRNIAMTYDAYLGEEGNSPKATFSRTI